MLDDRPDFIVSGSVLSIPQTIDLSGPEHDETYVVEPGDTLSEIAEAELGDPMRYPEIYEASRDTVQSNGHKLSDPDLIRPGWRLTIPGSERPDRPRSNTPTPSRTTRAPTPMSPPSRHRPSNRRPRDRRRGGAGVHRRR